MLRSDYKTHYKMYKAKKNVVYATMFTFAMLGSLGLAQTAKADTTENTENQPTVQTTVNSAAQATNQTVANSAVSSTVPASQVSTAPSSVTPAAPVSQTSQAASTAAPAAAVNTFNVNRNSTPITNVAQSLVQTNQSNQAQNVQGDWGWKGDLQPSTDKTIDVQIGKDYVQRMKLNISFDIDASQLKTGNVIDVAKLTQSSNNSGMANFNYENTSVPVYIKAQQIGYLTVTAQTLPSDRGAYGRKFSELDYKLKITADNLNYIGTQHISVNADWLGTLNYQGSWSFRGVKDSLITFNLIGNGGLNKSYKIHYAWPNDIQFSKYSDGYDDWAMSGQFLSDNGLTNPGIRVNNPIMKDADQAQLNIYQQSYGKSGDFSLDHNIQYAYRIRADKGNSVLLSPLDDYTKPALKIPLYNEDGELIRGDKYSWNVLEDGMVDHLIKIPNKRGADNLSLDQLKAENYEGMLASQQSDGTVLVYVNIPLKMIQIKASQLNDDNIQSLINNSEYINYKSKDYDEAYNLAKQELTTWLNGPLKGTPYQLDIGLSEWVQLSDPSVHPSDYIDVLDVNTGKVIKSAVEKGLFTSSMASGQSAVKLHVINAQNGADLVPLDLLQCEAKG